MCAPRIIAVALDNTYMSWIIGLVGKISKAGTIPAMLKNGGIYGLITDEHTTKTLPQRPNRI